MPLFDIVVCKSVQKVSFLIWCDITRYVVIHAPSSRCIHHLSEESLGIMLKRGSCKKRGKRARPKINPCKCPVVGCNSVWSKKTSTVDDELQHRVQEHLKVTYIFCKSFLF
jgi:hypothetical protein